MTELLYVVDEAIHCPVSTGESVPPSFATMPYKQISTDSINSVAVKHDWSSINRQATMSRDVQRSADWLISFYVTQTVVVVRVIC